MLHFWSLAIEEQYYLLLPLVVWLLRRHRGALGVAFVAVTAASVAYVVANRGDGWTHVVTALRERDAVIERDPDPLLEEVQRLGAITGGLHAALASDPLAPDFAPEPVTRADVEGWATAIAMTIRRSNRGS